MAANLAINIPGFSNFREIGSGGFGLVYSATEDMLHRQVAIKILRQGLDGSGRQRFEREGRAMARLSDHPNVVTVYSAGYTEDDRPFIIMELVPGGSLAEKLEANGPLNWRQTQNIGVKLADALSQAHELGVLHRDIKPANILMVGDEPKLTDFGIASLLDSNDATSTNISISWHHAPPETFDNKRDERSDLYSLGSTLHTLLNGTPPFFRVGENSINPLLNRILNNEPQSIVQPNVPLDLRRAISDTLRKDPNDRPQTAASLKERLEVVSHGQASNADTDEFVSNPNASSVGETGTYPVGSQPVGLKTTANSALSNTKTRSAKQTGKNRRIVTLATVALLVCLVGAAVGLMLQGPTGEEIVAPAEPAAAGPPDAGLTEGGLTEESGSDEALSSTALPSSTLPSSTLLSSSVPSADDQADEVTTSITEDEINVGLETSSSSTGSTTTVTLPSSTALASSTSLPSTTTRSSTTSDDAATATPAAPANGKALSFAPGMQSYILDSVLYINATGRPPAGGFVYRYRVTVNGVEVKTGTTSADTPEFSYALGSQTGRICAHMAVLTDNVPSSEEGTECVRFEPDGLPAPNLDATIGLNSLAASWSRVDGAVQYDYRVTIDGVGVYGATARPSEPFANYQFGGNRYGKICFHVEARPGFGGRSPEATVCKVNER